MGRNLASKTVPSIHRKPTRIKLHPHVEMQMGTNHCEDGSGRGFCTIVLSLTLLMGLNMVFLSQGWELECISDLEDLYVFSNYLFIIFSSVIHFQSLE